MEQGRAFSGKGSASFLVSKYYQHMLGLVIEQKVKFECHFVLTQRHIQIVCRAAMDIMPVLKIKINCEKCLFHSCSWK